MKIENKDQNIQNKKISVTVRNATESYIAYALAILINILFAYYMEEKLGMLALAISEILVLVPPALFVLFRKDDSVKRFALELPEIRDFFLAIPIFFGATMIQNGLSYILYPLIYGNSTVTDSSYTDKLFEGYHPFVILICIVLIPAICQEMLFRGYLRTAYTHKSKVFSALSILLPALLYACAHMNIYQFPLKLVMGIALGFIAYKTSSVILPIIFHFVASSNSLINYFTQKNASTEEQLISLKQSSYYIMAIIAISIGALLCFAGFRLFSKNKLSLLKKLIPVIVAIAICFVCVLLIYKNESSVLLNMSGKRDIGQGETITESFTVERNTNCTVNGMFSYGEGITSRIIIKDNDGEIIREYSTSADTGFTLEKGEYTLELIFEAEEGTQDTRVSYRIQLTGFGGYEASDS